MISKFQAAMEAVQQFQRKYEEAQRFRHNLPDNEQEIAAFEKLLNEFAFRKDGTAPTFSGPFVDWCRECFELAEIGNPDEARMPGNVPLEVERGERDPESFFEMLDVYAAKLQRILDASAPASFSYQGFEIENPERMGELRCRYLLDGIDYVVALFKKRGVTPLLRQTVTAVELLPDLPGAHGRYYVTGALVQLSAKMIGSGHGGGLGGKFLRHWINEVFLHEVGHHAHLHYLSPEGKAAWDEPWVGIENKRKDLDKAVKLVTLNERLRYFNLLNDMGWDLKKTLARLKDPVDKIKFGVWLRKPDMGEPLISAKQFRLTDRGKSYFKFWENPDAEIIRDGYVPGTDEFQRHKEWLVKRRKDVLGLDHAYGTPIPEDVVAELAAGDRVFSKAVDDAIAELEIVSEYGKKDEKEDFAETFVAFMDAPEKLSPTAKFRMQRALSLSGLYGKPVMRLAVKIAARFERAMSKL